MSKRISKEKLQEALSTSASFDEKQKQLVQLLKLDWLELAFFRFVEPLVFISTFNAWLNNSFVLDLL